jgi:alkylation response protein AidB-like acyl-CoA dehydrogenase
MIKSQMPGRHSSHVESSIDYLHFPDLLTAEEESFRKQVREFADTEIAPHISDYVDKAEFPEYLVSKFREFKFFDHLLKAPYGKGLSMVGIGAAAAELSRVDAGVATFAIVQWGLSMFTLEALASEEQK